MSRLERSYARLLVLLCILGASRAASAQEVATTLPRGLYIAPCLRDTVDEMLARSPTFRAQMEALGRARAIGISITLSASTSTTPADATFRRYESGVLLAFIRLHSIVGKAELIAHEVEHVLEQVEGVRVDKLARTGQEAWWTGRAYETSRAVEAGQQVASEMLRSDAVLTAKFVRPSP
jgi:hypothetical protein